MEWTMLFEHLYFKLSLRPSVFPSAPFFLAHTEGMVRGGCRGKGGTTKIEVCVEEVVVGVPDQSNHTGAATNPPPPPPYS
jgi:hypothetical protein